MIKCQNFVKNSEISIVFSLTIFNYRRQGKDPRGIFSHLNTLHDAGKQIVVTSDKFPKDIPNLEGRLRSRFEWGLDSRYPATGDRNQDRDY